MLTEFQTGSLVGLLMVLGSVAVLALYSRRLSSRVIDQVLALGLLSWTVFLVWQPRFSEMPPAPRDEFIEHMAFQLCVAVACRLVLDGTRLVGGITQPVWLTQVFGGGLLLLLWVVTGKELWMDAWEMSNSVIVSLVALALALRWHTYRHAQALWIAGLSLVLLGFSLAPDFWHHPKSLFGISGLFVFPAALIALWNIVSLRRRTPIAPVGTANEAERERQRIAQEVHDGVGSQLVGILSSLNPHDPQQQALALALERCLLELKITVDSLQPTPPGLLDGLALLRYRLQPGVDRMGIQLNWHVEPHPVIEQLPSLVVTHALRITQEAVANTLRHSQAKHLTVSCHHDESRHMTLLSVRDDGIGLLQVVPDRSGRGLTGMRRRADEAGIQLSIESPAGHGCLISLGIPTLQDHVETAPRSSTPLSQELTADITRPVA